MSSINVSPFRCTAEDLEGLDNKTRDGLQPMLESLNITLRQVVAALNSTTVGQTFNYTFATDETGNAYLNFVTSLTGKPFSGVIDQIYRTDQQPMAAPYSVSWAMTANGPQMLIVGLDPLVQYAITVTFK